MVVQKIIDCLLKQKHNEKNFAKNLDIVIITITIRSSGFPSFFKTKLILKFENGHYIGTQLMHFVSFGHSSILRNKLINFFKM